MFEIEFNNLTMAKINNFDTVKQRLSLKFLKFPCLKLI